MSSRKEGSDPPAAAEEPLLEALLEAVVPQQLAGQRLDKVAAALFAPHSRVRLQQWIEAGRLRIDGQRCQRRQQVRAGQRLQLRPTPRYTADEAPAAEEIPLDVLYRDASLLVLDKPAGLVVHPATGHPGNTLLNALLHLDPSLAALPRAGLVHRLDKDTTGLMAVARSEQAWQSLVGQLRDRSMSRGYLALVWGEPRASGTLDGPLGRHPKNRLKMAVRPDGRPARTHFRVRNRYRHCTELEVQLETGRTHQIRVHLTAAGFPLVGDPLYTGGLPSLRDLPAPVREAMQNFPRQALHAFDLALLHPVSAEQVRWQRQPPADYLGLRKLLAEDADNR